MYKKMLNVTDLSAYMFCPRKFYIERIKGLRKPPTRPMIEGSIRHKILEEFSNKEKQLVNSLGEQSQTNEITKQQVIEFYNEKLNELISRIFQKNDRMIYRFKIQPLELKNKIKTAMNNEILLRAQSIINTIEKGFSGDELWPNLNPKYLSELRLTSSQLGLKGKIDRVMLNIQNGKIQEIIPYELKTRTSDKIWPSDEIQLTAYGMLLEDNYDRNILFGILEAGNQKHEMAINQEKKDKVQETIKEIRELYKIYDSAEAREKKIKFPKGFKKCKSCPWTEECNEI